MSFSFVIGLSLILTHELDAMTAREWRIFPPLSRLSDENGRWLFVALHVPLFAWMLWGLTGPEQASWRVGFDVFLIAHAFAHLLLHRHPDNGFRRPLSWVLIGGAAVAGALDLWLGALQEVV